MIASAAMAEPAASDTPSPAGHAPRNGPPAPPDGAPGRSPLFVAGLLVGAAVACCGCAGLVGFFQQLMGVSLEVG